MRLLPLLLAGGGLFAEQLPVYPLPGSQASSNSTVSLLQDIAKVQRMAYGQNANDANANYNKIIELKAQNQTIISNQVQVLTKCDQLQKSTDRVALLASGILLVLGIIWGQYSWRLFVLAKNQRSFF